MGLLNRLVEDEAVLAEAVAQPPTWLLTHPWACVR